MHIIMLQKICFLFTGNFIRAENTYSSKQELCSTFIIVCFNIYVDATPLHTLFLFEHSSNRFFIFFPF